MVVFLRQHDGDFIETIRPAAVRARSATNIVFPPFSMISSSFKECDLTDDDLDDVTALFDDVGRTAITSL